MLSYKQLPVDIGKDKVGIRLSPYGPFNDIQHGPDTDEVLQLLAEKLNALGILYVHLVAHSSMGAPEVKPSILQKIRAAFKGKYILSGGLLHAGRKGYTDYPVLETAAA